MFSLNILLLKQSIFELTSDILVYVWGNATTSFFSIVSSQFSYPKKLTS